MRRRLVIIFEYIKSGHELITILIVYLAIGGIRLGGPDLKVTYDLQALAPATRIKSTLGTKARDASHRDELRANVSRFVASPNLMRIEVENTTHSRVTDVEVRVSGVAEAIDAAVSSSSSTINAQAESLATYEVRDRVISFPKLTEVPPRGRITILIWGKILPVLDDAVVVEAAVPRVHVVERQALSGFRLFVARNATAITFVLVAYFLATAMRRVRRQDESHVECP
jgi:hypothetical protein